MYQFVDGGKRYLPGEWPTEDKMFDPDGAVDDLRDATARRGAAQPREPALAADRRLAELGTSVGAPVDRRQPGLDERGRWCG